MVGNQSKARERTGLASGAQDSSAAPSLDGGWVSDIGSNVAKDRAEDEVEDASRVESNPAKLDPVEGDSEPDLEPDTEQQINQELLALSQTGRQDSPTHGMTDDSDGEGVSDAVLESVVREIVGKVKQRYDDEKRQFHRKLEQAFRQRLTQIEQRATRQLKRKLHSARKKDRAALAEKDARLNEMTDSLNKLLVEVSSRKKSLDQTSREFEQKLIESDVVQNEVHDLGKLLTEQATALGDALVDEPAREPISIAPPSVPRMNPRGDDS